MFNQTLGGCVTGEAKLAPAFDLAEHGVKGIVHTVGPVWGASEQSELGSIAEELQLASCYRSSLALAASSEFRGLAFPAISTGVYGFPKQRAAQIATREIRLWLTEHSLPARVVLCCFSEADANTYREVLAS